MDLRFTFLLLILLALLALFVKPAHANHHCTDISLIKIPETL
jgi:hypothetical protein